MECLRVLAQDFLELLLVNKTRIDLGLHNLLVLVAFGCKLDTLHDFLGQEVLLPLVALLLQELIKSVFDVFGEVEELHAKLLN